MKIHFIGGGTENYFSAGDASYIELPDGSNLAVDFCSAEGSGHVREEYARMGIRRLDRIIISHYHHDHVNGIYNLLEGGLDIRGAEVYVPDPAAMIPVVEDPESEYNKIVFFVFPGILEMLRGAGCRIIVPSREGEAYDMGGARVSFFNTDQLYYAGRTRNYNNWSLCARVEYGSTSVFFPGDIAPEAEKHIAPCLTRCNVLKAQHHGWEHNIMCREYIDALCPDAVVSMDGTAHDTYIMEPSSPLQTWCEEHNVPNYRTRQNGTITLNISENGMHFENSPRSFLRHPK